MSLLTNVLKLWRTGQYLLPADSGFSPKHLIAGRVGWWLDPLDFRYARQDSAGATAYTAVEQGVGMAVDKSANGLTFVQASAPAKPVVSARVNLLLDTEDLTAVASWTPMNGETGSVPIITPGQLAPDGTLTATRIQLDRGAGTSSSDYSLVRQAIGDGITLRSRKVWVKSNTGVDQTFALIATISDSVVTAKSSWGEVSPDDHPAAQTDFSTYGPVPTSQVVDILVWHPSMVDVANAHLPYQRVNTATDYDTAGFPHSLKFDGAATNLVGASGGGASTAFYFGAAVKFGKVGAVQTIVSDAGANTGFKIRTTAANQIEISAGNGAAFTAVNTTETFAAGDVAFIELLDNGTNLSACLGNGTPATVARPAVSAGTAQITLGKANNAASEYSGVSIFSAVYLKDYCPTAAERADYKRWALQRAGVAS